MELRLRFEPESKTGSGRDPIDALGPPYVQLAKALHESRVSAMGLAI
jgi:hypothetical protein